MTGKGKGRKKARLLASLEEEGEAYLEELPEQLQDQAGHRLHRFSASARNEAGLEVLKARATLKYPRPKPAPVAA